MSSPFKLNITKHLLNVTSFSQIAGSNIFFCLVAKMNTCSCWSHISNNSSALYFRVVL